MAYSCSRSGKTLARVCLRLIMANLSGLSPELLLSAIKKHLKPAFSRSTARAPRSSSNALVLDPLRHFWQSIRELWISVPSRRPFPPTSTTRGAAIIHLTVL